jgi:hypothetical protein
MLHEEGSSDSPTAFVTEGGWSGTAYGIMRVGDLAYRLNDQEAFFLRREGQRLLLAGVASFAKLLRPYGLIPSDGLFIDIYALRGFCKLFAGDITFRIPNFKAVDINDDVNGDINGPAIPIS